MLQYLFRLTAGRQEQDQGEKDLKVGEINTKLDELAAAASAEEKTAVLQWLVQRSSARMLKWITQIILKDLKVGLLGMKPDSSPVQENALSYRQAYSAVDALLALLRFSHDSASNCCFVCLPTCLAALCGMLQIGMSDKTILKDFHPDAEDLYNVTMDLSTVCTELKDRSKRMPRRVCHHCLTH